MSRRLHLRPVITTVGWIAAIAALGVLLSSLLHSTNFTVRLATVLFCVLAVARPTDAVLVAAAFAGFGGILGLLAGIPTLRAEEALVVASLFGWCVRAAFPRSGVRRALHGINATPVALFGLTVICSAAVWQRVHQTETAYLTSYAGDLWRSVSTQYFVNLDRFSELTSTAAILESLGLYLAVASACRLSRTFYDRALRMLVVGGAGLGALSVTRIAEVALRNPGAITQLQKSYAGLRISPQIPDLIAAAAYFGLCWIAALGLALQRQRGRLFIVLAMALLLAGLYLTGSRSGIGAAAGGIGAFAYLTLRRDNRLQTRRIIGFAMIALIGCAIAFPKIIGHDLAGTTAGESLRMRVELVKASAGVLETHPVFGVGIDRFFLYVDRFASPQLKAMWNGRKNPHNDFVRMATEFGVIGFGLFVWTLAACAKRIRVALRPGADASLAGLVGGLIAFVITMFISNPLMVHPVCYVFWIALGLATGKAAGELTMTATARDLAEQRPSRRNVVLSVAGCALIASVPFRAAGEIRSTDLTGVTYGLSDWRLSTDGVASRLSGAEATLFVPAGVRVMEVTLRGTLPTRGIQTVRVRLDGRLADELAIGPERKQLRIVLPPDQPSRTRRIDLQVTPTWIHADANSSSSDRRPIGVEVGEIVLSR